VTENQEFARLVSLACHDLRTPLATIYGFARTLTRTVELEEPASRYVAMIDAAAEQMGALLDDLGLIARIEAGRYEPLQQQRDTLELARNAAERAGSGCSASGEGAAVVLEGEPVERAIASLAEAARRHGGVESVEIVVRGRELAIAPVVAAAAPVVLAEDLKDLGAAVALRVLAVFGADVRLGDGSLVVAL
jgi:signal transduction histidine kinase